MLFREAEPDDFEDIMRLYRQLHPNDPAVQDRLLQSLRTADAKTAYLARPA